MAKPELHTLEPVSKAQNDVSSSIVERLRVPGGWLYVVIHVYMNRATQTTTFVPDPPEE